MCVPPGPLQPRHIKLTAAASYEACAVTGSTSPGGRARPQASADAAWTVGEKQTPSWVHTHPTRAHTDAPCHLSPSPQHTRLRAHTHAYSPLRLHAQAELTLPRSPPCPPSLAHAPTPASAHSATSRHILGFLHWPGETHQALPCLPAPHPGSRARPSTHTYTHTQHTHTPSRGESLPLARPRPGHPPAASLRVLLVSPSALSGPAWSRSVAGDLSGGKGAASPPPPDSPLRPARAAPPSPPPSGEGPRQAAGGPPGSAPRGAGSGGGRARAREPASPRARERSGEAGRGRAAEPGLERRRPRRRRLGREGPTDRRTHERTERRREGETWLARRSGASGGRWALPRAAGCSAPPRPPAPGGSFLARAGRGVRGPGLASLKVRGTRPSLLEPGSALSAAPTPVAPAAHAAPSHSRTRVGGRWGAGRIGGGAGAVGEQGSRPGGVGSRGLRSHLRAARRCEVWRWGCEPLPSFHWPAFPPGCQRQRPGIRRQVAAARSVPRSF